MSKPDLSNLDASDRASSELEYVLKSDKKVAEAKERVSVQEALQQARVYQPAVKRNVTRVLFISQDTTLLNPDTQSLDGFLDLSDLFEEVHILILRQGIAPKNPVLRVSGNVWLYTASARHWWQIPKAGIKLIQEQLVFASGFRPDLVVARDPFESALVALQVAKTFNRPTQLHILEDSASGSLAKNATFSFWRRIIPFFTIKHFLSIRTTTGAGKRFIAKRFTIPDVSALPRFQNYQSLISAAPTLNLRDKYRPFVFVMLFIGALRHESTLYRALDAARFVLRNPRVGLVVLGDGPAKGEFQKRAKILGVEQQVVFESKVTDIGPYLKSANLLLVTDTSTESDEVVLQGAAAGVPLVMAETVRRKDVFENGESAFLCPPEDVQGFADAINTLLNDMPLRHRFSERAQAIMKDSFHQDLEEYKEAYRTSVEQAMFIDLEADFSEQVG